MTSLRLPCRGILAVVDYTPKEVMAAAGVTPNVLDYWSRTRLVTADDGGRYQPRSVSLAIVLAEASRLGAAGRDLAAIAVALSGPVDAWPEHLWLDSRGIVHPVDEAAAALVLHVRRVLAHAGGPLLAAFDAA
jgi:hypothetical protein